PEALYRIDWESPPARETVAHRPGVVLVGALPGAEHEGLAELVGTLDDDSPAPGIVLAPVGGEDARAAAHEALELLQEWLARARAGGRGVGVVRRGGVGTGPGEIPDLAGAAAWGLVRSGQAEHPERLLLIDVDGSEASYAALAASAAAAGEIEESQLA